MSALTSRPALGGVEGHHPEGMPILTGQEIGDDGLGAGLSRVGLPVPAAEFTEVIEHEIDGAVMALSKRRYC
jgi:hypothetical protein